MYCAFPTVDAFVIADADDNATAAAAADDDVDRDDTDHAHEHGDSKMIRRIENNMIQLLNSVWNEK